MAPRQRFVDPVLWKSEKFSALTIRQRLLFVGLFSNADDDGRIKATARSLLLTIFPGDGIPLEEITKDLEAIASLKMIILYNSSEDGRLAYIVNWERFQHPKYPKPSVLPAPPMVSEPFPQDSGNIPGSMEESSGKDEGTFPERSSMDWIGLDRDGLDRDGLDSLVPSVPSDTGPTEILPEKIIEKPKDPRIKNAIDHYHTEFKRILGMTPVISGPKDGAGLKRLFAVLDKDFPGEAAGTEMCRLITVFLESDDEFIAKSGRTLGVFCACFAKIRAPAGIRAVGPGRISPPESFKGGMVKI